MFCFRSVSLLLMVGLSTTGIFALTPCINGNADGFACNEVDLISFVSLAEMGGNGVDANDIWGWTDPQDGTEYVIIGLENGTAFLDISDPENPVYLGKLQSNYQFASPWRDIKVYNNYAFIVSDFYINNNHGMQVFDLTDLRRVNNPPATFTADNVYTQFGQAHNVAINEDTGFAYGIGTNTCSGGLHAVDISNPRNPSFAGCFSLDGYTHDAQCVTYNGPDSAYSGQEICFNANEDSLTIADVSNKSDQLMLGKGLYSQRGYAHQGWLTADQRYFILGDETDEQNFGIKTRTLIFDVSVLTNPTLIGEYFHSTNAIDHNLYVLGHFVYEANYLAGLRILDLIDVGQGELTEVGYFDFDASDSASFNGAWSVYPYFGSGTIAVSHINNGLYLLRATHERADVSVSQNWSRNPPLAERSLFVELTVENSGPVGATTTTLTDTLPGNTSFVGYTASQGSCSHNLGVVTCDLGGLSIGGSANVTLEVFVDSTGLTENIADVSSAEPDPEGANNSSNQTATALDPLLDEDSDGFSNENDCAPLDEQAWAIPTEAQALIVSKNPGAELSWNSPASPGGPAARYDVIRAVSPADLDTATCIENDDTDLQATDATVPTSLFTYLVGAENVCGRTLGNTSSGAPRSSNACP